LACALEYRIQGVEPDSIYTLLTGDLVYLYAYFQYEIYILFAADIFHILLKHYRMYIPWTSQSPKLLDALIPSPSCLSHYFLIINMITFLKHNLAALVHGTARGRHRLSSHISARKALQDAALISANNNRLVISRQWKYQGV
jgi:hypothetical protein